MIRSIFVAMCVYKCISSDICGGNVKCEMYALFWIGSSSWSYSMIASSKQRLLKLEDQQKKLANESDPTFESEIAEIREQFNAAKQRFMKIPDALKDMPKVNPKGFCSRFSAM